MSSDEVDEIYTRLLKTYEEEGYVNPKVALNYHVMELMEEGKTREAAILQLYRNPEERERLEKRKEMLEKKRLERERLVQEQRVAVEHQVNQLKEKIAELTTLFSKGEISRESYVTAVKTLEKNIEDLKPQVKFRRETTREIGEESARVVFAEPSAWWWLVPFLFGILGGIVGYIGVKDRDAYMASKLLWFGIIWTVIDVIVYYAILSYYFSIPF